MAGIAKLWYKLVAYFERKMQEPEGGCGKCGICHHVCQLLEKAPLSGKTEDPTNGSEQGVDKH